MPFFMGKQVFLLEAKKGKQRKNTKKNNENKKNWRV